MFCGKSVGLHVVQSSPLKTYFHIDKLPLSIPSINTSAKYCASEILVLHTSCACILDTVLSASREREKKRKKKCHISVSLSGACSGDRRDREGIENPLPPCRASYHPLTFAGCSLHPLPPCQ